MLQQLLFIILLTAALIILSYMTIIWTRPFKTRSPLPRRRFAFESAPELFRYVEPDYYLAPNSIRLTRLSGAQINASWRINREHWRNMGKDAAELLEEGKLILRLYRSGELLQIQDVLIKNPSGNLSLELGETESCCASLGVKEGDHFTPWMFSNTVIGAKEMECRKSRRL